MRWHIGQEIVGLITTPSKSVIKGEIYIIKGLRASACKCINGCDIDTGFRLFNGFSDLYCSDCGHSEAIVNGVVWLGEDFFAPLEYDYAAIEELLTIKEKV